MPPREFHVQRAGMPRWCYVLLFSFVFQQIVCLTHCYQPLFSRLINAFWAASSNLSSSSEASMGLMQ